MSIFCVLLKHLSATIYTKCGGQIKRMPFFQSQIPNTDCQKSWSQQIYHLRNDVNIFNNQHPRDTVCNGNVHGSFPDSSLSGVVVFSF